MALAVDHSARDQQQSSTFLQPMVGASVVAWEKSPRGKPVEAELDNAAAVAQKCRRVSGIGVAKRAELFVIAADEGRAGMDPM